MDATAGAGQGASVALSADGNTALVGGPSDGSSGATMGPGAAWVYTRANGAWAQQGLKLVGSGANGATSGSVALSADGNTAIVGGPYLGGAFAPTGGVWIFTRGSDQTWRQQAGPLTGTGSTGYPRQGASVAISADGNTALVGGPADNNNLGAVWVFTRSNNGGWSQQGYKLVGTGAVSSAQQGTSVALSADGNIALVGGPHDNNFTGAVWVFARDGNGVWFQQGNKLTGTAALNAMLGNSVALSADGSMALAGAPGRDPSGGAFVYARDFAGAWTQQAIVAPAAGSSGHPGFAVALSADGNTAILGSPFDSAGELWIFKRSAEGAWNQDTPKFTGSGAVGYAQEGISVALSADGRTAMAGGNRDNASLGAAWVFTQPVRLTIQPLRNFMQGQGGAVYTLTVHNDGATATSGTVTVVDTLPASLTATDISGVGWTCTLVSLTCSRSDAVPAGMDYPPITLTVTVASDAPAQVVNQAVVSGGGLILLVARQVTPILPSFDDVAVADPFLPAINLMRVYGITSGCSATPPMYCPGDPISRGQMAVFVVRAVMGSDTFTYTGAPYFSDVTAFNPYFKWIQKLRDLGVTSGCGASTTYCPDDAMTRGQMAVFIMRARLGASATFQNPTTPYFTDVPADNVWFPWVQEMRALGTTSGCGETTYCPDDAVTRGQMAVFLMRGAFNLLLPASTPMLAAVSPAAAAAGATVVVTITGQNTHFASGKTKVTAGAGITVSQVVIVDGETLTAQLTIDGNATPGPRSIIATTDSEEATLPNGFRVQ